MHQMQSILIQRMRKHYLNMRLHHYQYQWRYQWRAKNIKDLNKNTVFIDEDFIPSNEFECSTPLSYFKMFFDENMLDYIVLQTNIYSTQCNINKGAIGTDKAELERYLGILLTMSLISVPYFWFN